MPLIKPSGQSDIREYYLQILFKRKKILLTPIFCSFVLALAACIFLPREYEASTTILVEEKGTFTGAVKGIVVRSPLQERLRTIREELLSWSRLLEVMRELGLDVTLKTPRALEKYIHKLQRKIYVRQKGSDVIQIAFRGRDPQVVQNFVNTMTQKYIEKNLRAERQETYSAIDFLEEQIESYRKRISESERALSEFRSKNIGVISMPENVLFEEMTKLQTELESNNLEILNLEQEIQTIDRQLSGEQEIVVTESLKEMNPVLVELKNRLNGLRSQLSVLELKYTDKHPSVIETKRLIELTENQLNLESEQITKSQTETRNPIFQALKEQKQKMQIRLNTLSARKKNLQDMLSQQESRVKNIPRVEQTLAELTRGVEVNKKIHNDLLVRLEQSKISQQLEATDRGAHFEILDPARLPQVPVGPSLFKILILGMFLGVGMGGGLLYLLEFLDHSFRGVMDATQYLEVPILATIPAIVTLRDLARERIHQIVFMISVTLFVLVGIFLIAWGSHLMVKYNIR